jgi:RAD51-like protein 3
MTSKFNLYAMKWLVGAFAMRLSLYPCLPENIVSSLDQIGIRTDSDLLFPSTTADILRRLPPGTMNIQDLRHYTAQIIEESSALGVRGDVLLSLERAKQEQKLDFASGVINLDALLNGFGGSRVFEVSGEKASGKTVSRTGSQ